MSPRRLLTFTVVLSIDADKGDALEGDRGFLDPDGEFGLPMTGLEIHSDLLAWSLARQAFETLGERLDAVVLDASGHVGDEIPSEISEF